MDALVLEDRVVVKTGAAEASAAARQEYLAQFQPD